MSFFYDNVCKEFQNVWPGNTKINHHLGKIERTLVFKVLPSLSGLTVLSFFEKMLKTCFPSNVRFFFRFFDLRYIGMYYYGSFNLPPVFWVRFYCFIATCFHIKLIICSLVDS